MGVQTAHHRVKFRLYHLPVRFLQADDVGLATGQIADDGIGAVAGRTIGTVSEVLHIER